MKSNYTIIKLFTQWGEWTEQVLAKVCKSGLFTKAINYCYF